MDFPAVLRQPSPTHCHLDHIGRIQLVSYRLPNCFRMVTLFRGQMGSARTQRHADPQDDTSCFRREHPPLPHRYMPACVDLFPVTVKVDDFTSPSPTALAEAARAIRKSNTQWSEGQFRGMLEIAQAHPLSPGIVPAGPIDALVTDHTRAGAGLQEDWGPPGLGQWEAFREPYLGRVPPCSEITLLPRWPNGAIDILFAGEVVVLERLRNDKTMNAVASFQFVMDDFIRRIAKEKDTAKL